MHSEHADGYAQVLRAPQFNWLFDRELWQLARELFGPRCDFVESRVQFYTALTDGNRSLTSINTSSDLIPASAQVNEWHQLLLTARVLVTYDAGRLTFVGTQDTDVQSASFGEVRRPEARNYRNGLPERDGLFCEKIFGPERSWHCYCGKYRGPNHAGRRCERCGVDIAHSAVRRVRFGHLELVAPVIHPWYAEALPGWLGITPRTVRQIIDYERWLVIESNDPDLSPGTLLTDREWAAIRHDHPEIRAALGAEAIELLLQRLPRSSRLTFDGVVMRRLPVLPPDLRPMIRLESGRFATSDLNDLYRGVISRNNRLSRLIDLGAPEPLINNERRVLQRSVDNLLDNERSERPFSSPDRRVLVSVAGALTSKVMRGTTAREGFLFRPVDFSASTRMIVGETPGVDTVQLPVRLARQLFEPLLRGPQHRMQGAAGGGAASAKPSGSGEPDDALDDDYGDELVLLAAARGPWPLFAVRFRTTHEVSLTVCSELIDMLGWDNFGEPVAVFAVLTDEARHDAVRLMPSVLAAEPATSGVKGGQHESPFDLAGADFLRRLPDWVVQRRTFPCRLGDEFLLAT
jgi:hypothetical protein